ncbi:MAG: hypothetical protein K2X77_25345 [Candidatus Obscuribacterales bacterium]|nr:hypothetical protein [Candidatus Obscuribacterales bacterium]
MSPQTKRNTIAFVVLSFLLFALASTRLTAKPSSDLAVENMVAKSGVHYLLLKPADSVDVSFEIQRPQKSQAEVLACIPAAFSSKKGGISGFYAYGGEPYNIPTMDRAISGAIEFTNGKISIFDTNRGALINDELLKKLKRNKSSMFQQFQLVKDGHPEPFHDKSNYQRRCIAIMNNGKNAFIESDESITMTEFANDLAELGVANAVYTDMGPWDEGWYRNPENGKIVVIGHDRLLTGRQTNWAVFRRPSAK